MISTASTVLLVITERLHIAPQKHLTLFSAGILAAKTPQSRAVVAILFVAIVVDTESTFPSIPSSAYWPFVSTNKKEN
jgi:hypothetical protein